MGILAGANVIMPNLSPEFACKNYELYDHKKYSGMENAEAIEKSEMIWRRSVMRSKYLREILSKGERNMYNPLSKKAEEFIHHEEIMDTLAYAEKNKKQCGIDRRDFKQGQRA